VSEWVDALKEQAREALPQVEGTLRVNGLHAPVEVIRDRWGVPHIYAQDLHDLFFAQGFVVASERLFQLDFLLRFSNGRLSTMFSQMAVAIDRFARTIGLNRAAHRIVATYDDQSLEMVTAALEGHVAWLEAMPALPVEYRILDLEPDPVPHGTEGLAYGAAGGAFMAWSLSRNFDEELLRASVAEKLGWDAMQVLFPPSTTEPPVAIPGKQGGTASRRSAMDLLRETPLSPPGQGSNNWVVSGSRTVSGKPLLANDPHLQLQTPSIWFECHLSAPGYEASGVTLPFAPGIVIGHTPHHAWGLTNTEGDVQDLYLERLSEDGTAALYQGTWEPLTIHREEIEVRGGDTEVLEVRETRHGPILDSYLIGIATPQVVEGGISETYALRWVGADHAVQPSTLVRVAQARSFQEFREAARGWECPGQNMVYADVDGNIGYQCSGLYPIRRKGDGTVPVPGWTDEYEWDGWIPFEDLPWSENPEDGLLATANHRIHEDSYPFLITKDFIPPFRQRRIVELLTATGRHSPETFGGIQHDTVSIAAREALPLLVEMEPADERQKEALAHLAAWDADMAADSAPAAIYQAWGKHLAREVLAPRVGPELFAHYYANRQWDSEFMYRVLPAMLRYPTARWFGADGRAARDEVLRRALDGALDELASGLGDDMGAWRWGALHRAVFSHPLAVLGGMEELFVAGSEEIGGDEHTVAAAGFEPGVGFGVVSGSSWRHIIDLSDMDRSVGMHTTGQSGNPASEHWNDFVGPWARGQYHPLPLSRAAVEEHADHRLTLEPG
jgi:penicillin G amidase